MSFCQQNTVAGHVDASNFFRRRKWELPAGPWGEDYSPSEISGELEKLEKRMESIQLVGIPNPGDPVGLAITLLRSVVLMQRVLVEVTGFGVAERISKIVNHGDFDYVSEALRVREKYLKEMIRRNVDRNNFEKLRNEVSNQMTAPTNNSRPLSQEHVKERGDLRELVERMHAQLFLVVDAKDSFEALASSWIRRVLANMLGRKPKAFATSALEWVEKTFPKVMDLAYVGVDANFVLEALFVRQRFLYELASPNGKSSGPTASNAYSVWKDRENEDREFKDSMTKGIFLSDNTFEGQVDSWLEAASSNFEVEIKDKFL
jgi:hypothetical protein